MKTKLFTLIMMIANIFFISFTLTACGDADYSQADEACYREPNHIPEIHWAWFEAQQALNKMEKDQKDFLQTCDPEKRDCQAEFDKQEKANNRIYVDAVNKIPLRICGAKILHINEQGDIVPSAQDTDDDGIANSEEFKIGYDPCSKHSTQDPSCKEDGQLDYDGDGMPNNNDRDGLKCNRGTSIYAPDTISHSGYVFILDCV